MIALDGVPIVSLVFCVSNNRVSTVIGSFNEAYAKSSPGLLAFEYVVKWAFERQYDVDFGSGAERYKQFWARGNVTNVWTLRTVASWWGRIGMIVQRLPFEVKHTAREGAFAAPSSTAGARYASTGNSHEI